MLMPSFAFDWNSARRIRVLPRGPGPQHPRGLPTTLGWHPGDPQKSGLHPPQVPALQLPGFKGRAVPSCGAARASKIPLASPHLPALTNSSK